MIDLIIPVYNAEDNLDKLIASICAQTKERKLIVTFVNDHCTDRSIEIIKKWKEFVSFPIRILTPPEKLYYPGLVRQYGIDRTSADYIMFLDSDDQLCPHAIEYLYSGILSQNCDIATSEMIVEEGNLNEKIQGLTEGGMTWLHGKIYKRSYLEKNDIVFPSGYNEDCAFNLQVLLNKPKLLECKKQTYIWKNNKNSLTRSTDSFIIKNYKDIINNYKWAFTRFINQNKDYLNSEKYRFHLLNTLSLFYALYNTMCFIEEDEEKKDEYILLCRKFVEETKANEIFNYKELDEKDKIILSSKMTSCPIITLFTFLYLINLKVDIRPEKIIKLVENKNDQNSNN